MKHPKTKLAALLITLALAASACGSSETSTDTTVAPESDTTGGETTVAIADDPAVDDTVAAAGDGFASTAQSDLGEILVDANGLTMYAYTEDSEGLPTCTGGCLGAWPAVTVEGDTLPEGLDPAVFSLVDGADGKQLRAGDWPLYFYAGDAGAGDTVGQGSADVWYVVSPTGDLIK